MSAGAGVISRLQCALNVCGVKMLFFKCKVACFESEVSKMTGGETSKRRGPGEAVCAMRMYLGMDV